MFLSLLHGMLVIAAAASELPGAEFYRAGSEAVVFSRFGEAVYAFGKCAECDPDLAPYALVRLGECHAAEGRAAEAEQSYREVLAAHPLGPWARMAQARLAAVLAQQGRRAEAGALYDPLTHVRIDPSWFETVRWDAAVNAMQTPGDRSRGFAAMGVFAVTGRYRYIRTNAARYLIDSASVEQRLLAAGILAETGGEKEFAQAAEALDRVKSSLPPEARARCEFLVGDLYLRMRNPKDGRAALERVVTAHPGTEWAAKALAALARSHFRGQNEPQGRALINRLVKEYPGSMDCAEALWWTARFFEEGGQPLNAISSYRKLADSCPSSMRADDALLAAGNLAATRSQFDEAQEAYALLGARYPDTRMGAEGWYRCGAVRERKGRADDAKAAYRRAGQGPLGGYYVHRALARLVEMGEPLGSAARPVAGGVVVSRPAPAPPVGLPPAAWTAEPWYRRLRFFGIEGLEEAEWEALGLVGAFDRLEKEGPIYQILAESGLAASAADFLSMSEWGLDAAAPTPARWRVAYPRAYWSAYSALAKETGLDPYLLLAVGLQESTFRARVGSSAGARGVMQLMPATAKGIAANEAAVDYTHAGRLEHPPSSIRLGAYYLMRMSERYRGNLVHAIPSYNAGPGNVNKWIKQGRSPDPAEFIEAIPFAETRGFAKRVLGNYAAYVSLYAAQNGAQ